MALKDLLLYVDNGKANAARIDAAIRLATAHDAHLTGLYVTPSVTAIPAFYEAQIPAEVIESQKRADQARAREAEQAFKTAVDRAGISSEWRSVEGDVTPILSLHARYMDLLVMGQADASDPLSLSEGDMEEVVLDAGRPVMVIPYIGAPDPIGRHIMVAWNASRESMRAIHDAMPLLEKAQTVNVLSINPPGGAAGDGDMPGADISLHLARHGIKVEASFTEAHDISVGDTLLSRAADKQVDLIVMGAYGHSRYRELILGGATRHLLQSMTVPVLMSH